jgi:DNA invertase Pin-like site-specific DNA recombinase
MFMTKRKSKVTVAPQPGWAVYLRVSDEEAQNPDASKERQRFYLRKGILERSELLVIEEYSDLLTGRNPLRKDYQRMLQDARLGKFSHVAVERADRFGRNDTEALRAIDELHELGVAVRFANQPDLDPMDPDDRIIVTLSFTLARRESMLLGMRVKSAAQAKRQAGGFVGRPPDGYKFVEDAQPSRKSYAKRTHHLEIDPERAPLWRLAWDFLLEDKRTLAEICEELHTRGYRYRTGRPFVEIKADGTRITNTSTLGRAYHNWTYAGWVVNEEEGIAPRTLRGDWQGLVTTEELEQGIAILQKRTSHRVVRRKHDYLLKGILYYLPADRRMVRLSGSTSNARRPAGGTPYYCVPSSNVNFPCREIEEQIPGQLSRIQVATQWVPSIRAAYSDDVAQKLGVIQPDQRQEIEAALKGIESEEGRAARLYASGKITDEVWDSLWAEWQDRRRELRTTLDALDVQHAVYVHDLDHALEIITHVGSLYNRLTRSDQKELLRLMVERVLVNTEGQVRLELRAPFAYLQALAERAREDGEGIAGQTKTSRMAGQCSELVPYGDPTYTQSEHETLLAETADALIDYFERTDFPARELLHQLVFGSD